MAGYSHFLCTNVVALHRYPATMANRHRFAAARKLVIPHGHIPRAGEIHPLRSALAEDDIILNADAPVQAGRVGHVRVDIDADAACSHNASLLSVPAADH